MNAQILKNMMTPENIHCIQKHQTSATSDDSAANAKKINNRLKSERIALKRPAVFVSS